MKKLLLIISFLCLAFSGFSQTDSTNLAERMKIPVKGKHTASIITAVAIIPAEIALYSYARNGDLNSIEPFFIGTLTFLALPLTVYIIEETQLKRKAKIQVSGSALSLVFPIR